MKEIVFDIEVYPDWWCIVYSDPDYTNIGVIQSTDKDYMRKNTRYTNCYLFNRI